MKRGIYKLRNYTFQDANPGSAAIERTSFYFIANEYLWKKFDIEGHYTSDEALDFSKNFMVDDLIKMALKESIRSLNLKSKDFHFEKDGETEDLRDFVFDEDILDEESNLFSQFKQLLLNNWNDDMDWYYFRADSMKNANIHDDNDKKTLYNHYFDALDEFKNEESFLEYCDTYNADWEERMGLRRINYELFEFGDYHCIDNTVSRKELRDFFIKNGYYIDENLLVFNPALWQVFGYYYGKNNGLSEIESASFGNILSNFFTGYPVPDLFKKVSTGETITMKKYFKEDLISNVTHSIIERKIDGLLIDHTKDIFYTIYDIYKNRIQDFEFKTKRLEFRVSQRQYDQFMKLEGESKSDKLDSLMNYPTEKIEDSLLPDIKLDEESLNEWKKGNKVTGIYEFRDEIGLILESMEYYEGFVKDEVYDMEEEFISKEEYEMILEDISKMAEKEADEIMKEYVEDLRKEDK